MCLDKLIPPLATLGAGFGGVWLAYRLERRARRKEEADHHVAAYHQAIYTILIMGDRLLYYKTEAIDKHRDDSAPWFTMPSQLVASNASMTFDIPGLLFLWRAPNPNLLPRMITGEHLFLQARDAIERRSRIMLDEAKPLCAKAGIAIGDRVTDAQLQDILGHDRVHTLKMLTSLIVDQVNEALASLREVNDMLFDAMKAMYPKRKFKRLAISDFTSRQPGDPA